MQVIRTSVGIEPADAALLEQLLRDGRRRAAVEQWRFTTDQRRLLDTIDAMARAHRTAAADVIGPERTSADGHAAMLAPLTTSEAADVLGCSERHVRRLIDSQAIGARKVRGRWLVDRSDCLSRKDHTP